MATKATLEANNVALKAQLDALQQQINALTQGAPTPAPKPADVPTVTRGYFKRAPDAAKGETKWVDDPTRPCVIVHIPDIDGKKVKDEKMTPEAFHARYVTHHATLVAQFKALT